MDRGRRRRCVESANAENACEIGPVVVDGYGRPDRAPRICRAQPGNVQAEALLRRGRYAGRHDVVAVVVAVGAHVHRDLARGVRRGCCGHCDRRVALNRAIEHLVADGGGNGFAGHAGVAVPLSGVAVERPRSRRGGGIGGVLRLVPGDGHHPQVHGQGDEAEQDDQTNDNQRQHRSTSFRLISPNHGSLPIPRVISLSCFSAA